MQDNINSIAQRFFRQAQQFPEKPVYIQFVSKSDLTGRAEKHPIYIGRNFAQVARRISAISELLKKIGVRKGDKVAILSNTRPEWLEADLAILGLGAVVVSVYPSLLDNELAYILWDSEAKFIFAENQEQFDKLSRIAAKEVLMPACDDHPSSSQRVDISAVVSFENVSSDSSDFKSYDFEKSLQEFDGSAATFEPTVSLGDIACIVYTSGTTGAPKGVLQTHGNHLANVRQARQGSLYASDSSIYMMLPLAHSFAKLMGYIGFLEAVQLQFPSVSDHKSSKINQRQAIHELSSSECSIYPLVPRILEKLKDGIETKASKAGAFGSLLRLTLKSCSKRNTNLLSAFVYILTTPVRKALKKKLFGANFKYVISGGAKLPIDVNRFFASLGIQILEGYGLTETCVATNCNRPNNNKIGTVGPVLSDDIKIKIAEDGEILFSGPNIALGYHRKPQATAKAWSNQSWFHTGDLGQLDEQQRLVITGRKKEIIVTAGGKKVVPDKVEAILKANRLISQAVLIGEGRPYCIAIITLSQEQLQSSNIEQNQIDAELEKFLDNVNSELASFESVKSLILIQEEFSMDNGYLTPTLKVKRSKVMQAFEEQINAAYGLKERKKIIR